MVMVLLSFLNGCCCYRKNAGEARNQFPLAGTICQHVAPSFSLEPWTKHTRKKHNHNDNYVKSITAVFQNIWCIPYGEFRFVNSASELSPTCRFLPSVFISRAHLHIWSSTTPQDAIPLPLPPPFHPSLYPLYSPCVVMCLEVSAVWWQSKIVASCEISRNEWGKGRWKILLLLVSKIDR